MGMITRTGMMTYSAARDEYAANQTSEKSGGGNVFVGGNGNNIVTNYANGTKIHTGDGDDTVTTIAGGVVIDTKDGDDYIIAVGFGTDINSGDGNDKIYAQGSEVSIDYGTGKNEVYLSGNKFTFAEDKATQGTTIKSAAFNFQYVKNKGLILSDLYNIEDYLTEEILYDEDTEDVEDVEEDE